jgi:hypothetical protein
MTNGDHNWVFVSDETYRAALANRDRALLLYAAERADNAALRRLVWWQWGGLLLAAVVLAWVMWMAG